MELALNLLWLMLGVPAIWMWRHESVCAKDCRCFGGIRSFVLFGCVLMLLFPVISATDDLNAMRQEIRDIRQGPDGLIYLVTRQDAEHSPKSGMVLRIEPID